MRAFQRNIATQLLTLEQDAPFVTFFFALVDGKTEAMIATGVYTSLEFERRTKRL